ncbi:L-type lectin-domain containing protein [Roseivirga sp. BDSF3-8]|uniref:L-type lectin-domain containing protein n=1 Tax=Roseivirga sp. BDSF3-8 TaxID=3241598 RepID=UPI0035326471
MAVLQHFLPTLLLVALSLPIKAQFSLMGSAKNMPDGCIQLTPAEPYSEGLAYYNTLLDLKYDFEIGFDIYFGARDENGADGIAFVIQNDPRGNQAYGTWGECLGYGTWDRSRPGGTYIAPSIAVEFDTYQNPGQNDPDMDHVVYLEQGSNFHTIYFNNNDPAYNLEDNRLHDFRFRWEANEQKLTILLDGYTVYTGVKDLANDIFEGTTLVRWGFTASTGRKYNLQYFCLRQLVFNPSSDNTPLIYHSE